MHGQRDPRRHRPRQAARGRRRAPSCSSMGEPAPRTKHPGPVIIRGSEGMAVQFAQCCRPIPGDPIIGVINKGQGMVIHTHDCPVIAKTRADPDKCLDVEWDPRPRSSSTSASSWSRSTSAACSPDRSRDRGSRVQHRERGMDPRGRQPLQHSHFTLQVNDRLHLARSCAPCAAFPRSCASLESRAGPDHPTTWSYSTFGADAQAIVPTEPVIGIGAVALGVLGRDSAGGLATGRKTILERLGVTRQIHARPDRLGLITAGCDEQEHQRCSCE